MQTKRIRVYVTQDNIDEGQKFNPIACPVALALKRVTGVQHHVNILDRRIFGQMPVENTSAIKKFIKTFDMGYFVKPFYFYMQVSE